MRNYFRLYDIQSMEVGIEKRIHYRLTVIHAFRDGKGRSVRAFVNMMILKMNVFPFF